MFFAVNAGKRSVVLDLKDAKDRAELLRLAEDADVFVTSLRPGAAERLGLGPDEVPARIYCRIDAFGPGTARRGARLRPADAGVRGSPLGDGRAGRPDGAHRRVARRLRDGVVGGDRDPVRAAVGRAARGRGLALRDRARARRVPRRGRARRRRAGQARLRVPAHRAVPGVQDARRRGDARRRERPAVRRARATARAACRRALRDERVARRAPRGARRARAGTARGASRPRSGSSGCGESRSRPCRRSARPPSTRTPARSGSCRRSDGRERLAEPLRIDGERVRVDTPPPELGQPAR